MLCRACAAELNQCVIDLGSAPPSNAYLCANELDAPELWYPLRVLLCPHCGLLQTEDFTEREKLFNRQYDYFSSYSPSWLQHAHSYVEQVCARYAITGRDWVVEIAANDGYLLQYFAARDIPCLGVEPTASTAAAARAKGIAIREAFFGRELAQDLVRTQRKAKLIVANNVLAHVPDLHDFIAGMALLLADDGVITFEFPHLLQLLQGNQFDTIYHEHYSYLSVLALHPVFQQHQLHLIDVEKLPTHGGSLRLHVAHRDSALAVSTRVAAVIDAEKAAGLNTTTPYQTLNAAMRRVRRDFLAYLSQCERNGLSVAAYGAAAKGNTLLNYCGVRADRILWVVDANPHKQGKYLPGSRIPIVAEALVRQQRPDRILILPWNLRDEISTQLSYIRDWGGKFVVAIPSLQEF